MISAKVCLELDMLSAPETPSSASCLDSGRTQSFSTTLVSQGAGMRARYRSYLGILGGAPWSVSEPDEDGYTVHHSRSILKFVFLNSQIAFYDA